MEEMSYLGEKVDLSRPFWDFTGADWIVAMGNIAVLGVLFSFGLLMLFGVVGKIMDSRGKKFPPWKTPNKAVGALILAPGGGGLLAGLLALLCGGVFFPIAGNLYVVNGSEAEMAFEYDGEPSSLPPRTWVRLQTRTKPANCTIKATLDGGDTLQKPCLEGISVLNLSSYQNVGWSQPSYSGNDDDTPQYLEGPAIPFGTGLWPVVPSLDVAMYDFGRESPWSMTVREDDADLPVIDLEFMD